MVLVLVCCFGGGEEGLRFGGLEGGFEVFGGSVVHGRERGVFEGWYMSVGLVLSSWIVE